ncbi:hypothetical protein NE237_026469 [Protea cynaroides]|uniref:Large ribosomal subunit protein uL30-like ferredoxin-like fold domain-containing protein n=1 Tax=Protea cynaroides TaxID=273540 RepID=A0A9Q0K2R5_9MAGN|nr:hypothetical protein NE237_026469 [Protea cynaroides]
MHPKTRKILHYLRLKRIFAGMFVKANDGIMDMLRRVEPYVTYGYPNLKSVKELIYKKGCGKIDGQRVPLTDNNIIEQALGKYGIICMQKILYMRLLLLGCILKMLSVFCGPSSSTSQKKGHNVILFNGLEVDYSAHSAKDAVYDDYDPTDDLHGAGLASLNEEINPKRIKTPGLTS